MLLDIPVIGPWLQKWLSTIVAVVGFTGMLGALFFLALTYAENRHLTKVNANLDARINDPSTGYVVKLTQAETNATQLQGAITSQKKQFDAKAAADAATLAATAAALKTAQAETAAARRKSTAILSAPADLEAVDAAVLESLK